MRFWKHSSRNCKNILYMMAVRKKVASSQVFLWLNSLRKGEKEPERRLGTHLNPTCDSPAQVSYSGGSKMSLRGVFTDLVTLTHRPLGRQIHRYRIAFLVASVAMVRVEGTGLHFFLCHTKFMARYKCTWIGQVCGMRALYEQMKVEVVIMGMMGVLTTRALSVVVQWLHTWPMHFVWLWK